MLIFVLYQLLSMLWTQTSYDESHAYFKVYLLWFAIPILALSLKKTHLKNIITIFLYAMVINEILAYGMYFEFWPINGRGADYPSPFMHHTGYSIFMAFTAVILLNRLYSDLYNIKEKIIMGLFFITVSGNLFISQGRIGQLAFAIAIFVAGILHFKLRIKTLLFSILIVSSIFTVAYQTSPMFEQRVQKGINDVNKIKEGNLHSSWGIRLAYIIVGTEIIKDHPLFGVGLEDTKTEAKKYFETTQLNLPQYIKENMQKMHFHNQYLMVTLQSGFIGLFLFLTMFFYLLKLPIEDVELKRLSILFTTILLVGFISDPFIMSGDVKSLFLLFTSIFVAASIPNNTKEN